MLGCSSQIKSVIDMSIVNEPELSDVSLSNSLDIESLLSRITRRILESLELKDILTATAAEVRTFLKIDRVKIYKFHPDSCGQVVAESIYEERLPALLGLNFPADDIPLHARELFVKARMRSIVNVTIGQLGQEFLRDPETGEVVPEEVRFRPVDPCHQEYLTAMGVKASLVVPIFHQEQLWGLLAAHHSESWSASEQLLHGVQMVVDQLSVAIAQSELLNQARQKGRREETINRIASALHSLSNIDLQAALESVVAELQGAGGRLYMPSRLGRNSNVPAEAPPDSSIDSAFDSAFSLYCCGDQPVVPEGFSFQEIEQCNAWCRYFQTEHTHQPEVWALSNLYQVPELRNLQPAFRPTSIRGMLVVPLRYDCKLLGYLTIFRNEVETETLWAGQCDPDQRQVQARLSFEIWRELKQGQAYEWSTYDIELAQALGSHFATAIQQYEMHQQVQLLNATLEQQVQERTAKLQQALVDLQQAQTQLIQSEKIASLGQLVAGVAHEVNNPINFIYGNLSHARDYVDDLLGLLSLYQQAFPQTSSTIQEREQAIDIGFIAEDLPKILASMKTGADRIRQVVLSLLNFSRHDQAEIKSVNIHEGIDSTLLILHHRLKGRSDLPSIEIIREYGNLPLVQCYASQLNQVFMNLLSNAIDAVELQQLYAVRPQGGEIKIQTALSQTEAGEPRAVIRVLDNGAGISEGVLPRIFDPFFTTKPVGKGTGLGLSISHHIVVDQHGGTLQCIPQPEEGIEFRIEIPLYQPGIS